MNANVKKLDEAIFRHMQKAHPDKSLEELAQLTEAAMGEPPSNVGEAWCQVWQETEAELQLQIPKATFNMWLSGAELVAVDEGDPICFRILVKNKRAKGWIDNRLHKTINRTLSLLAKRPSVIETVTEAPVLSIPSPPENFPNGTATVEKKPKVVKSSRQSNSSGHKGSDDGTIQYRNIRKPTDPLKGHLQVSHYAIRFWRPFLGPELFDLHLIVSSYAYEFEVLHKDPPQLKLLARKLGLGDGVNKLKGRPAYGKKQKSKGYVGLLDLLAVHRLCFYWNEGIGRGTKHYFDHLTKVDDLPLLTPTQVATLAEEDQKEHWEWLCLHTKTDENEWLLDDRESRIEPLPEMLGVEDS
jgi:hypothetical protein